MAVGAVAPVPLLSGQFRLSRLLRFDLRRSSRRQSRGVFDGNFSRLHGLLDLSNAIDRQETAALIRSVHPDMIGKLEPMFERTARKAAMQVALGGRLLIFAGDSQKVGVEGDLEIILGKSATAIEIRQLSSPVRNCLHFCSRPSQTQWPWLSDTQQTRRSDKVAFVEAQRHVE